MRRTATTYIFTLSLLLLAMLLPGAAGCSGGASDALDRAEEVMEVSPDSAYAILTDSSLFPSGDREERARHALLLTQATDKTDRPLDSDSLIETALHYFRDHGEDSYQMRSHFYKGRFLAESGDGPGSIIEYVKAGEYAARSGDPFWEGKIAEETAIVYSDNLNEKEHLHYALKALALFRKAGRKDFENYQLYEVASALQSNGEAAKSIGYARQAVRNGDYENAMRLEARLLALTDSTLRSKLNAGFGQALTDRLAYERELNALQREVSWLRLGAVAGGAAIIIAILSFLFFRKLKQQKLQHRQEKEMLSSLQTSLTALQEETEATARRLRDSRLRKQELTAEKLEYMKETLDGLLKEINGMEGAREQVRTRKAIDRITEEFRPGSKSFAEMEELADSLSGGLLSSFRDEMKGLREPDHRFFMLAILGLDGGEALRVLMEERSQKSIYNLRYRIKQKIVSDRPPHSDEFLKIL